MAAYDKNKLENTFLIEEGELLFDKKFISKEHFQNIKSQMPALKTSSFFIRIGFFLLGCLLMSSILGLISLAFMDIFQRNEYLMFYMGGIIAIAGCEILSKNDYYKHGLNDAFVLSIILFWSVAIGMSSNSVTLAFAMLILAGSFACIRYVHSISALITCIGFVALSVDLVIEHKLCNKAYLPFIGLFLGLIFYFVNQLLTKNEKFYFYKNSFFLVKIFSLLLIYFSMNYLVVRELSELLMDIVVEKGKDIPFAVIFYVLTFAIPVFYIAYGLSKKDRTFLLIGLFTFGFGVFTIRYYYAILPIETALVLGGILLFAISYFAIQKLKMNITGLTFLPDRGMDSSFILNAQAFLITAQNIKQPVSSESKMSFGGGGFSGGGAGESF
ncbi:MAG: hypothetical protein ACI7YS_13790 [Flavobacterium sp.]